MNLLSNFLLMVFAVASMSVMADVTQIGNQELKELRTQGAILVDIRRADEWRHSGVVEGSHLLTFFDARGKYDVPKFLAELKEIVPEDKPFVLICEVGGRSGSVARLLDKKLGMTSVHNLTRGIRHWITENEEVIPYNP